MLKDLSLQKKKIVCWEPGGHYQQHYQIMHLVLAEYEKELPINWVVDLDICKKTFKYLSFHSLFFLQITHFPFYVSFKQYVEIYFRLFFFRFFRFFPSSCDVLIHVSQNRDGESGTDGRTDGQPPKWMPSVGRAYKNISNAFTEHVMLVCVGSYTI